MTLSNSRIDTVMNLEVLMLCCEVITLLANTSIERAGSYQPEKP